MIPIILITGVMAAGKSTAAQAVAERLDRSVHLRGDLFRRMVVGGREDMGPEPDDEAIHQLRLRYQAAYRVADLYSAAEFTVVYQDVILGGLLEEVIELYRGRALHVVVLCPPAVVVTAREAARPKKGYGAVTVTELQRGLDATPRLGLWLDNSDQSPAQTADAILSNLESARIVWR